MGDSLKRWWRGLVSRVFSLVHDFAHLIYWYSVSFIDNSVRRVGTEALQLNATATHEQRVGVDMAPRREQWSFFLSLPPIDVQVQSWNSLQQISRFSLVPFLRNRGPPVSLYTSTRVRHRVCESGSRRHHH